MVSSLTRHIEAGDIIKPWLILGPFYEDLSADVQGLTLFERAGATVGRTAMDEVVAQARALLTTTPVEGERATFRNHTARWALVRKPERYLSWGRYNISNHLGAAFLTTCLTPDAAGLRQWRLTAAISLRAIVAINGSVVYDTANDPVKREHGVFEYTFAAPLAAGENIITVALFRLGRMAQIGCRLEITDGDVAARVPLPDTVSLDARERIEQEVTSLGLARDIFYPHHPVGLELLQAPKHQVQVQLFSEDGVLLHEAEPTTAGPLTLCQGSSLPDGAYQMVTSWLLNNAPLTTVTFDIKKVTPVVAPKDVDQLEIRKRMVLENYANNEERRPIWTQVARYALAKAGLATLPVDEETIRETCDFIAARKDCADFVIQGLLRIMYWEREERRLSAESNALMKDTVLGFKYWVDEPGDTVMYMGSENHRLLFHVAEWLAGQLFPTEEFTNSRQRGLYHATKGRAYITEWLRQRGRFGFDEWHSNSYYPINIAPLLNVYDFTIHEDYKLRQMAGAVLDYMFFNIAADALNGVFGTTHGRSYGIYIKYPDFEGTAATCWLLYGTGSLIKGTSGMSPVSLATSAYTAPPLLNAIAHDDQAVVESRQRQGLLRGTEQSAHFVVFRTPDYMLSGLQDHRKGEHESSSHVAQVTLGQKAGESPAVIFWSCPLTSGEGSGLRPDYWSGHISLPRVIQYRNVLSLSWRLPPYAWMTHCFFEPARFDEVCFIKVEQVDNSPTGQVDNSPTGQVNNSPTGQVDNLSYMWAFARVGQGYVGIYSQHGFEIGQTGQYAGRELVCYARDNTWIVECGREADWGSFNSFVNELSRAEIQVERTDTGDILTYPSAFVGDFVTGWNARPTINGVPVPLRGYPLVESAWAHSDFGSGEMTLHHGNDVHEIWFNQ